MLRRATHFHLLLREICSDSALHALDRVAFRFTKTHSWEIRVQRYHDALDVRYFVHFTIPHVFRVHS